MDKIAHKIRGRLNSLEVEIKDLRNIENLSFRGRSFVEGKISAYHEEMHTLRELLDETI